MSNPAEFSRAVHCRVGPRWKNRECRAHEPIRQWRSRHLLGAWLLSRKTREASGFPGKNPENAKHCRVSLVGVPVNSRVALFIVVPSGSPKKRVFSTIAWKSAMTQASKCRNFRAEDTWPIRALPCLVPATIRQTSPRASRALKLYRSRRLVNAVATIYLSLAHGVARLAFEIAPTPACCMAWRSGFRSTPRHRTRLLATPPHLGPSKPSANGSG